MDATLDIASGLVYFKNYDTLKIEEAMIKCFKILFGLIASQKKINHARSPFAIHYIMILDIAFIIVMIVAIFKGLSKGFIVGIFSLLAFVIGLAAALKFAAIVAVYLQGKGMASSKWLPAISFFLVFIVVILLVGLGARLIKKTIQLAMLGWVDSLLGIFLYIIIYIIILSVVLFFADKMFLLRPQVIADSYTYKYVEPWGPKVINNLGNIIPVFKDMFIQLQGFFDGLTKKPV